MLNYIKNKLIYFVNGCIEKFYQLNKIMKILILTLTPIFIIVIWIGYINNENFRRNRHLIESHVYTKIDNSDFIDITKLMKETNVKIDNGVIFCGKGKILLNTEYRPAQLKLPNGNYLIFYLQRGTDTIYHKGLLDVVEHNSPCILALNLKLPDNYSIEEDEGVTSSDGPKG